MVPFNQTRRQPTRREADRLPHQVATYRNRNFSHWRFAPYHVQHNTIHRNTLAAFVACVAYLANLVFRVVLQDSPGARMAAAGFFSQSWVPCSLLGMLCHGSMHTNCGIPGLLQIRV